MRKTNLLFCVGRFQQDVQSHWEGLPKIWPVVTGMCDWRGLALRHSAAIRQPSANCCMHEGLAHVAQWPGSTRQGCPGVAWWLAAWTRH